MRRALPGLLGLLLLGGCAAGPAADPPAIPPAQTTAPVADGVVSTGGQRPEISWPAVPGASGYRVVVVPASGPSWAWSGAETAVVVGGGQEGRGGPGFALDGPAQVWVSALDPAGRLIAHSIHHLSD